MEEHFIYLTLIQNETIETPRFCIVHNVLKTSPHSRGYNKHKLSAWTWSSSGVVERDLTPQKHDLVLKEGDPQWYMNQYLTSTDQR